MTCDWDLWFVQNDPSSIWGVKAEDWGRFVTLKNLVIDCALTDFQCFKEFTFIQKPLTIWRNCQREEWTQKLVRLSQKQRQAVVDNMKFCYWRMTVWSCPWFCCLVIPVPEIQMLCTVKAQETAVRSQQEHIKNISSSSSRKPGIIHSLKGLKDSNSAKTRLNFNQYRAIHSTSSCLCEAFCFRRSEWLWAEGGATLGFGWVPLRLWDWQYLVCRTFRKLSPVVHQKVRIAEYVFETSMPMLKQAGGTTHVVVGHLEKAPHTRMCHVMCYVWSPLPRNPFIFAIHFQVAQVLRVLPVGSFGGPSRWKLRSEPFEAFILLDFVIFGPLKQAISFSQTHLFGGFWEMDGQVRGWEMKTLQPFVHLRGLCYRHTLVATP